LVKAVGTVRFNAPGTDQNGTTAEQGAETTKAVQQTIFSDEGHLRHRVTYDCRLYRTNIIHVKYKLHHKIQYNMSIKQQTDVAINTAMINSQQSDVINLYW